MSYGILLKVSVAKFRSGESFLSGLYKSKNEQIMSMFGVGSQGVTIPDESRTLGMKFIVRSSTCNFVQCFGRLDLPQNFRHE